MTDGETRKAIDSNDRLTSQDYWVSYYSQSNNSPEVIKKIVGKYDMFWDEMVNSLAYPPRTVLEIGAFPGRYLAYLAHKYNLRPTGIDFNPDSARFSETMRVMGVDDYSYIVADFLKAKPIEQFDLVISNGFVEHFDDFDSVLDLHVKYLKPGGAMVIMVPNKRFVRYFYGVLFDHANLKLHNLAVMRKSVFNRFANRNNLETLRLTYFGGFPYKVHQRLSGVRRVAQSILARAFRAVNPLLQRYPSRLWSSALVGVFKKNN